MRKKILILISIMLVLTPIITSAETSSNESQKGILNTLAADVPTWETGDSWTYYCHLTSDDSDITYNGLQFTVTSASGSNYETSISASVEGEFTFYFSDKQIVVNFQEATLSGQALFEKSTLAAKESDILLSGRASIGGVPANFELNMDLRIIPSFYPVKFPLNVGNSWDIPKSDITGKLDLTASVLKLEDIFFGESIGQYSVRCSEFIEGYNVGGASYDCYKITSNDGGLTQIYYSEQAKNIVKAIGPDVELTLSTPGAPNKPRKPSGPTNGESGTSYTYSTSTTDPEGDDVYYLFDWGDGSDSGWLGPYSSGETVSQSKTWNRKGTFAVKVKAKDTNDIQSSWSESLSVSIPRSRSFFRLNLIEWINTIFERFPILQELLLI